EAVRTVTRAFGDQASESPPTPGQPEEAATADDHGTSDGSRIPQLEAGSTASLDAAAAADEAGKQAAAAVSDAKAEA
ncbi:SPFH/Band 7/PHB domain protein, partial [Streptomyces brasiliscabiei]